MLVLALAVGVTAFGYLYRQLRIVPPAALRHAETLTRSFGRAVAGAASLTVLVADVLRLLTSPHRPSTSQSHAINWATEPDELDPDVDPELDADLFD